MRFSLPFSRAQGIYFGPTAAFQSLPKALPQLSFAPQREIPTQSQELLELANEAGLEQRTTLWLPPLSEQIAGLRERKNCKLIINLLPPQPESFLARYLTAQRSLELLVGIDCLIAGLRPAQTWMVLDRHDHDLKRRWQNLLPPRKVTLKRVLNVYPHAHPTPLLWNMLRLRLPVAHNPPSVNVCMADAWSLVCLGQLRLYGRANSARPVQFFSDDQEPVCLEVNLGQKITDICDLLGWSWQGQEIITNGLMAGMLQSAPHAQVHTDTEMVALRQEANPERPVACIQCGWCVDHCPTALNPAHLYENILVQRKQSVLTTAQHCIACGLCSYVCPSRLPLAEYIRREQAHLARGGPS